MHAQTPVQIAGVTCDLDATETALTTLLGAMTWIRMPGIHFGPDTCTLHGGPADFVADISLSMEFADVSAAGAGVPDLEIAYFPDEIRAFFDYVKQEQQ